MSKRTIVILGSTGSIGASTLKVVAAYPDRFSILGLVGGDNTEKLAEQIREFRPRWIATRTEEGKADVKKRLGSFSAPEMFCGTEGAQNLVSRPEVDIVVSGIVGAAGLRPTLAAIEAGKRVALANKESLVVAGALLSRRARETGAELLPVDSEHSAVFQALAGAQKDQVRRIILTASGGPFFLHPDMDLDQVTPEQALDHPNWKMGAKITIDSATMMNKGLEIIEARWLFDLPLEQIDVVIHPQSVVHSMVEYVDGSILAQLGVPDMCGPIAYALSFPDRLANVTRPLDFSSAETLTFSPPDTKRFPSLLLARQALQKGDTAPAVLNGANEVSVASFLNKQIRFSDITRVNTEVLSSYRPTPAVSLDDFLAADTWGRKQAEKLIQEQE